MIIEVEQKDRESRTFNGFLYDTQEAAKEAETQALEAAKAEQERLEELESRTVYGKVYKTVEKANKARAKKSVGIIFSLAILMIPPLSLITLKKGYSYFARFCSIGWLIFFTWWVLVGDDAYNKKDVQASPPAIEETAQDSQTSETVNSQETVASLPESPPENTEQTPVAETTVSPSFDCAKASTTAENLICSDNDLATEDVKLADIYKKVMAQTSDKERIKREQLLWLKKLRDIGNEAPSMMLETYQDRITQLSRELQN